MFNRTLLREYFWIALPLTLLVAAAFWLAFQFVEPAPPRTFVMSTGSETGGYHAFGRRYAAELAKSGVTLELSPSSGSVENLARLAAPSSGVSVSLIQGGIAPSDKAATSSIVSLGRVFLEPLWVFYRAPETVERLTAFRGKRIAVGPEGSGTRPLALAILKLNDIDEANTKLLPITGDAAAKALDAGEIDAAFLAQAPQAPIIQAMLRNPTTKLLNFSQAEAYTRTLPYLTSVTLPEGVVDFVNNIPARDVRMLAASTALAATESLHPALVGLLVEAAKTVHSGGGMFQRIGEYPKASDPEFEMSDDAARIYKDGPPFLQRYLPFWLATFLDRMKVMLLPIATVMIPLLKLGPALYRWSIRRRIFFWYERLKRLEDRVRTDFKGENRAAHAAEVLEIEEAVGTIPVPTAYADQFYSLRAAIDLVRQRLANRVMLPA